MTYDTIIVLGTDFVHDPDGKERKAKAELASQLYKKHKAAIILSGGFPTRKDLSEAADMRRYIKGISSRSIILEEQSKTTVGNAFYSNKIMKKKKLKSAMIVCSPHHLFRAELVFRRMAKGIKIEGSPIKQQFGFLKTLIHYLRELRIFIIYLFRGIRNSDKSIS